MIGNWDYQLPMIRICTKCFCGLSFELFYKQKIGRWGISSVCKECANIFQKMYYSTDKGKEMLRRHRLTAKSKATQKRYQQSPKGKIAYNKVSNKYRTTDRGRKIRKAYEQTIEYKAKKKVWAKNLANTLHGREGIIRRGHKRKALIKENFDLTAAEWRAIKKRFKYRCAYCGEKKKLTRDCVIPLNRGGCYTKFNIVPACLSCNCSKKDKIIPFITSLLPPDTIKIIEKRKPIEKTRPPQGTLW